MTPREWRKEVDVLAAQYGYEIELSKNNHYKLTKFDRPPVFAAVSASDWRAVKNLRSHLRRNEQAHDART